MQNNKLGIGAVRSFSCISILTTSTTIMVTLSVVGNVLVIAYAEHRSPEPTSTRAASPNRKRSIF